MVSMSVHEPDGEGRSIWSLRWLEGGGWEEGEGGKGRTRRGRGGALVAYCVLCLEGWNKTG